jgi:DNA-binding CsgD family transcriptional regulator
VTATSVLVVSGDALFGDAVRIVLESSGWMVVGVERDAVRALSIAGRELPDRVLVLADPERLRAESFVRRLAGSELAPGVVVQWRDDDAPPGALPPTASIDELLEAILTPTTISLNEASSSQELAMLGTLTPRERTILSLLAHGRTRAQVAAELGVTPNTVRTHTQHLYAKLRLHTASDLVRFAARQGLVNPD